MGNETIRVVRHKSAALGPPQHSAAPAAPHVKRWDAWMDLTAPDIKKFDTIKDGDRIADYQNVTLKGFLSTFKGTTESDREGDYVEPGAFTQTLEIFRRNPVLLVDHRNSVENIAGSFTAVKETAQGLQVEARLSNAPTEIMRDVRAKVAEGHIRSLSMGGVFHYNTDGRGIFKVDLYEGSLVAIPANPDAVFSVRELTAEEQKKLN